LSIWLKTTDSDISPLQEYSIPFEAQCNGSRKRLPDNINNYDHNILGLSNRVAISGRALTPDIPGRSRSTLNRRTGREYTRQDRGNMNISFRPVENKTDPSEFCSGCYNKKVIEDKHTSFMKQTHEKSTENLYLVEEVMKDKSLRKQQAIEQKEAQKQLLNKGNYEKNDKKYISPKITDRYEPPANNVYQYEGYGTDYQRMVEDYKEMKRQALRKQVEEKLNQDQSANKKNNLLNLDLKSCGNLTLPSFMPRHNYKNEYKKTLLMQIEADREKRIKRREQERKNNVFVLEKGVCSDKLKRTNNELKQAYEKFIKEQERKKTERLRAKEEHGKYVKASIESYVQKLKHDKAVEMVMVVNNV